MKYLVTGAVGFLGTNLCLRLLNLGHDIIGLDNLSTGYNKNLQSLKKHNNFYFLKHDVVDPLPDVGKIDLIYNLACPASPPRYQKEPIQTFRTSVWGLWNVTAYAKKNRIPIFHASTSEVYGDPLVHPQKEDYLGNVNPIGIRACYDEGKRAGECMLMDYHRTTGNQVKIVRIFNTYGPYMDPNDGRVISNFLIQTIKQQPLTIYGNGKQTRSFCYVDDLIDGFIKMENSDRDFTGPVNLGNPNEITLLELVKLIEKLVDRNLTVKYLQLPKDDPKQRRPDITLAKTRLAWFPKTELAVGLEKTFDYFRGLSL